MSLLLFGDLALPDKRHFDFKNLMDFVKDKHCVLNLEGPIIDSKQVVPDNLTKYNLYNTTDCTVLLRRLNVKAVGLANNHVADYGVSSLAVTKNKLSSMGIGYFGLKGEGSHCMKVDNESFIIIAACSSITDCSPLVNAFEPAKLLIRIHELHKKNPDKKIIVYMHWGVELLPIPLPCDRQWAKRAIDEGAYAIIGHHPHVTQGIEVYKGRLIAYSLGNFILPQTTFYDKVLKYYTEEVYKQYCIEIFKDELIVHEAVCTEKDWWLDRSSTVKQFVKHSLVKNWHSLDDKEYLAYFQSSTKHHRGKFEKFFPTYRSYDDYSGFNNQILGVKSHIFQGVRRLAIRAGIHRPYVKVQDPNFC